MTTTKVLLLNATFEALGAIQPRRAMRLVYLGKAAVVEGGSPVLTSATFVFDASVIRLTRYIEDLPGRQRRSASKRMRILARDGFCCQYCDKRGTAFDLTVDHILPVSRGGSTSPENLVAACKPCNNRKGARTPEEARMPLLKNPAALVYGIDRAILCHEAESRPEWRKYLFLDPREDAA